MRRTGRPCRRTPRRRVRIGFSRARATTVLHLRSTAEDWYLLNCRDSCVIIDECDQLALATRQVNLALAVIRFLTAAGRVVVAISLIVCDSLTFGIDLPITSTVQPLSSLAFVDYVTV